jgi:uncharacterized protein (TIGR03067 family)
MFQRKPSARIIVALVVTLAVLAGTFSGASAQNSQQRKIAIEGTWTVQSAEFAGQPVGGLKGAQLVLSPGGKKQFMLPGGTVENGTYSIDDAKNPAQIDATTEGKPGTQRGIFAVEGDTLKMSLATGGARPGSFAASDRSDLLLIVLKRAAGKTEPVERKNGISPDRPSGTRSFRMGFTGFVYDTTPEAVAASRKFVQENGDIIAHHIEGAPWAEALSGQPFPPLLLESWKEKKAATPPNGQVYLAISPGRGELKIQEKAGPLPDELKGKTYDDPLVMKTYLAYCRRAIEFFQPDYLCIGIEVNEILRDGGEQKWNAYAALHQHVYSELKKEHGGLPIFASFTLHSTFQKRGAMLDSFKKLMHYNDLVAVSYYPFFVPEKDRLSALDWMTEQFDAFNKPYAVVETNDSAERLPLAQLKVVLEGTPEKQAAYYRKLLGLAQKRQFAFVISFVHQDYDALWEKIKGSSPELFKAWRDCGLVDENGNSRPALQVWKDYFALPLASG